MVIPAVLSKVVIGQSLTKVKDWLVSNWKPIVGTILVAVIFITPTCMYVNTKNDLQEAESKVIACVDDAKDQEEAADKAVTRIEYRDKIIEKDKIKYKTRVEKVYEKNAEAKAWADEPIPADVIDSM